MSIRILLLLSFAALLAAMSGCQTREAGGRSHPPVSHTVESTNSLLNASEVFADLQMRDVTDAVIIAWNKHAEEVVVRADAAKSTSP